MKKRMAILMLAASMSTMVFAGCGRITTLPGSQKVESNDTSAGKEADTSDDSSADAEDAAKEEVTKTDNDSKVDVKTNDASNNSDTTTTIGGKWVDLDNMQFAVNGHVYTLGKSTLQDMIDDGCPFNEDDIANAGNNLNKNSQSQGFRVTLGDYWTAQVYAGNYTDSNATAKDCPITEIYLPNHPDETQDILTFAFPLTMTEDELKSNAGEPTDSSNYDDGDYHQKKYEYTKDATKYYGDTGYKFEFMNGDLKYVTIEYLP